MDDLHMFVTAGSSDVYKPTNESVKLCLAVQG